MCCRHYGNIIQLCPAGEIGCHALVSSGQSSVMFRVCCYLRFSSSGCDGPSRLSNPTPDPDLSNPRKASLFSPSAQPLMSRLQPAQIVSPGPCKNRPFPHPTPLINACVLWSFHKRNFTEINMDLLAATWEICTWCSGTSCHHPKEHRLLPFDS